MSIAGPNQVENNNLSIDGDLNMHNNKIIGLNNPINKSDATNKQYVDNADRKRVLKSGDTMNGDLHLNIGTATIRQLGCSDITAGKEFILLLGNRENSVRYFPTKPITLKSSHGFLVKVGGNDFCQFDTNINVYNNKITQLAEPTDAQDAATKQYVDGIKSKITSLCYDGHIPPLGRNESKTGFVAEASSHLDLNFQPYMAFAPHLEDNAWVPNGQGGQYLQITCPKPVKIWKIRLCGRRDNNKITSWALSAGNNLDSLVNLLIASTVDVGSGNAVTNRRESLHISNVPIDYTAREIHVTSNEVFRIYRITITASEGLNPGISHFQIFTENVIF